MQTLCLLRMEVLHITPRRTKWKFTPTANFNGDARIDYLIEDGKQGTIPNSIILKVTSVNDAPTATFTTTQNTTEGNDKFTGQLTSTDVDLKQENGTANETAKYYFKSYSIDGAAAVTTAPAWLTIGETTGVWEFDPKHADFNTWQLVK